MGDAVRQALASPLEFPPLARAVVPGDKVVLALDRGVPQSPELLSGAVACCSWPGCWRKTSRWLRRPRPMRDAAIRLSCPARRRDSIATEVHDPKQRDSFSYLGATSDAKPIYINRVIYDADFVISIGCCGRIVARLPMTGALGRCSRRFPTPLRSRTIERASRATRRKTARVTPTKSAGFWAHASPFKSCQAETTDLARIGWRVGGRAEAAAACRGSLDFSSTGPGRPGRGDHRRRRGEQTWENVARALAASGRGNQREGAVAVCTNLAETLLPPRWIPSSATTTWTRL